MNNFRIEIASVPDRENLVAEIWYDQTLVAEINQEMEELEIELYLNNKKKFKLNEFLEMLEIAKKKL